MAAANQKFAKLHIILLWTPGRHVGLFKVGVAHLSSACKELVEVECWELSGSSSVFLASTVRIVA